MMILGPGGVAAAVVGVWACVWAVQSPAGQRLGAVPRIGAFGAAMFGLVALTSLALLAEGARGAVLGSPEVKAAAISQALQTWWRGMLVPMLLLPVAAGLKMARDPTEPKAPLAVLEWGALAAHVALSVVCLGAILVQVGALYALRSRGIGGPAAGALVSPAAWLGSASAVLLVLGPMAQGAAVWAWARFGPPAAGPKPGARSPAPTA